MIVFGIFLFLLVKNIVIWHQQMIVAMRSLTQIVTCNKRLQMFLKKFFNVFICKKLRNHCENKSNKIKCYRWNKNEYFVFCI